MEKKFKNNFLNEHFDKIKAGHIEQIRDRLRHIAAAEGSLSRPADGLAIEYRLRRIAKLAGCKKKDRLHFGTASYINSVFSQTQRDALLKLLIAIEEDVPWRGISWHKIYDRRSEQT